VPAAALAGVVAALVGAGAGAIAGSFVGVVTGRWPQGVAITGRSRCDACAAVLGPADLVPLLSFIALRGRCRHCGAAIAPRHLVIELAAAAIGAAMLMRWPGWQGLVSGLMLALAGWWLLALIVTDAEHQWLPDRLTLPLVPLALLVPASLPGWPPLAERLWGAGLGFAGLWAVGAGYRLLRGRDGLGGGDPKLMAGLGALLGGWALPFVLVAAALLGLVLAGLDALRGRPVSAATRLPLGALLAGTALPLVWLGPAWRDMLP
jgi:leader peptidase (prepilin peptidase)/N-methyltransferase